MRGTSIAIMITAMLGGSLAFAQQIVGQVVLGNTCTFQKNAEDPQYFLGTGNGISQFDSVVILNQINPEKETTEYYINGKYSAPKSTFGLVTTKQVLATSETGYTQASSVFVEAKQKMLLLDENGKEITIDQYVTENNAAGTGPIKTQVSIQHRVPKIGSPVIWWGYEFVYNYKWVGGVVTPTAKLNVVSWSEIGTGAAESVSEYGVTKGYNVRRFSLDLDCTRSNLVER